MVKKGVAQPYWTPHARSRAAARYPGVDLDSALAEATRPGKGIRKKIAKQCPGSARKLLAGCDEVKGRYWLVNSALRVVFVIHPPGAVITVFPLGHWQDEADEPLAPPPVVPIRMQVPVEPEPTPARKIQPQEPSGPPEPTQAPEATPLRKRRRFSTPAADDPLNLAIKGPMKGANVPFLG